MGLTFGRQNDKISKIKCTVAKVLVSANLSGFVNYDHKVFIRQTIVFNHFLTQSRNRGQAKR